MERLGQTFRILTLTLATIAGCSPGYVLSPSLVEAGENSTSKVSPVAGQTSIYDFTLNDIDGNPISLGQFRGKVMLVVNTASLCGNTPQYADLQALYDRYRDKGFEVLAFPANNFGQQEPGSNGEIKNFCYTKYSLTFPLFSKISVTGPDKHPLYHYLTEESPFPGEVEWNFQKYLIDRQGRVVGRYHHRTKPLADEVVRDVEGILAASR